MGKKKDTDLRRILTLKFHVFGCFYLRERIHNPVTVTRIAFKEKNVTFLDKDLHSDAINIIIFQSKYFSVSDWLKSHA